MADPPPTLKDRLRQWLPLVGALTLVGYFLASTDLAKVKDALQRADLTLFVISSGVATLLTWLYDSWCLTWLIAQTLGHRGQSDPRVGANSGASWREILPLKAASYLLNMLNYHAASLGMAYLVGRRKGVSFLEAAGALAILSYIDLIAVTAMAMVGVWMAPEFFGPYPALQTWLKTVAVLVFGGALTMALLIQSNWQLAILQKLRGLAPIRPLAALRPSAMLVGLLMRTGLITLYTCVAYWLMAAFGLHPQWGRLLVAMPILTVVGTIPISVSGFGSTQVLMRSFYAPFVAAGQPAQPVIDAFSTLYILGFLVWRLCLAAPFFRKISAELRERPAQNARDLSAP